MIHIQYYTQAKVKTIFNKIRKSQIIKVTSQMLAGSLQTAVPKNITKRVTR